MTEPKTSKARLDLRIEQQHSITPALRRAGAECFGRMIRAERIPSEIYELDGAKIRVVTSCQGILRVPEGAPLDCDAYVLMWCTSRPDGNPLPAHCFMVGWCTPDDIRHAETEVPIVGTYSGQRVSRLGVTTLRRTDEFEREFDVRLNRAYEWRPEPAANRHYVRPAKFERFKKGKRADDPEETGDYNAPLFDVT